MISCSRRNLCCAQEGKDKDDEDEESMAQALREEGFIDGSAQGAAVPAPKLEAKPGERRLRRVIHYSMPDGTPAEKCALTGH